MPAEPQEAAPERADGGGQTPALVPDLGGALTALAPLEQPPPVFSIIERGSDPPFLIPLPDEPGAIPIPSPRPQPQATAAAPRETGRSEAPPPRARRSQPRETSAAEGNPARPAPTARRERNLLPDSLLPTRPPAD